MTAAQTTRETLQHQVAGFTVTEWPGTGPVVLGLSGLGSHAPTWAPVAESLPQVRFLGMDLRGRGNGQGMAGPTGLRQHAKDVAAVLAELDLTDVTVVGHSMGAYLAPIVAQEATGRIAKLVLVDGGIRPALPFFMKPVLTRLAFKKDLNKADRDFTTVDEILKVGRVAPMLAGRPELESVVRRILEAEARCDNGVLHPKLDVSRAVEDAVDCFFGPDVEPALDALTVPAEVILAEHAKKQDDKPFISDKAVEPWRTRQPLLRVRRLPGNHMTVLFAPEVAAAISA